PSPAAGGEGDDLRGHRSRHRRPWPRGHRDDGLLAAADAEFSAWHAVHPDFRDGPEDPGQSDPAVAGVAPEYRLQKRHRHLRCRLAGEDGATNAGAAAEGNRIRQEMKRRILVSGHDVIRKVGEPPLTVTLIRVVLHVHEDVVFAAAAEQIDVPGT